ncbi:permease [Clostridium sp.]|uniref:permease n=1 Tax=Clostridium sp. TaxID=1506 RepID=UPI003216D785
MTGVILYTLAFILLIISFIKSKDKTIKAIKIAFKSFENIMPQFLGIIITVGILLSLIEPNTISKLIGSNSGFFGILTSSIIGSITMMPTFVAFSTGNSLLQSGAGYPQVGALISTLTMVGIMTFSLESRYMGKKAAFLRNFIAFLFAFVVAFFIGKVVFLL